MSSLAHSHRSIELRLKIKIFLKIKILIRVKQISLLLLLLLKKYNILMQKRGRSSLVSGIKWKQKHKKPKGYIESAAPAAFVSAADLQKMNSIPITRSII